MPNRRLERKSPQGGIVRIRPSHIILAAFLLPALFAAGSLTAPASGLPCILQDMRVSEDLGLMNFRFIEANGAGVSGGRAPMGVPGYVEILNDVLLGPVLQMTIQDSDPLTYGGIRAEVIATPEDIGSPYWYRWRFKLPTQWPDGHWMVISQWHGVWDEDDYEDRYETMIYRTDGQRLEIWNGYDPDRITSESSFTKRLLVSRPVERGTWVELIQSHRWSIKPGAGELSIWIDRSPIYSEKNHINTFNDKLGPYFKFGIYDYDHRGGFDKASISFDGYIVAGGGCSDLDEFLDKVDALP